jgi:vacuolar-type H+-ATPase subunit F/Vma7
MSTVVALGETHELEGFALVGITVLSATTPEAVVDAWHNLDRDVGLVILTPTAAHTLHPRLAGRPDTLTVVMP